MGGGDYEDILENGVTFENFDAMLEYMNKKPQYYSCVFSGKGTSSHDITNILTGGDRSNLACKGIAIRARDENYFDYLIFCGGNSYIYLGRYNNGTQTIYRIEGTQI